MQKGQYVDEYRKNAVNGASPLQLVIMLYDGAIRFCELGRAAMASGDRFAQNTNLVKAQRILTELTSCLDMKQGGEVAKNRRLWNLAWEQCDDVLVITRVTANGTQAIALYL